MDSRESQESRSLSKSPVRNSYKSRAAQKAIDLTHAITKKRQGSPLRERHQSSIADESFSRYEIPVREFKPIHRKQNSSLINIQTDERMRARVETLDMDQTSIRRRMNLVRDELDQVYVEKERKYQEFLMMSEQTENLNKKINSQTEIDIQNIRLDEEIQLAKEQGKILHKQIEGYHFSNQDTDLQINQTIETTKNNDVLYRKLESQIYSTEAAIEQTTRDNLAINQDIGLANHQNDNAMREEQVLLSELANLERLISIAQNEKNLLHNQLEMLSGTYTDCRRVLGQEFHDRARNINWKTKLVVMKLFGNELVRIQERMLVSGFKEIQGYSDFDKNCFSKLKNFSIIIHRLGMHNKQLSMNKWYNNAFKPLDTRWQNYDIALKISKERRLSKVFYSWRNNHLKRMKSYYSKTHSIKNIWEKLELYSQCELKRAMAIWKNAGRLKKLKTSRIRNIILKRYRLYLNEAMLTWKNYNWEICQEVRILLLQREYSQKIFLNRLFSELKQQTITMKRARLVALGHVLKGWRSYMTYKRQLIQTNYLAIQMGRLNRMQNLKAVFDAMVCHKESRKYKIMNQALSNDMDIAIEQHRQFNAAHTDKMTTKSKMRSGSIVRDMIGKRLFAYFAHWRDHTTKFKNHMNIKIKDLIIRFYRERCLAYFQNWKKLAATKKRHQKKKMIMELEETSKTMENEGIAEHQKQKSQVEAVRSVHERKHNKMFTKFWLRLQKNALDRWRERLHEHRAGKARSNQVLGKMRNRFLKDAFNRLNKFHLKGKQGDKNEKQLEHMIETLRKRTLRKHYHAFCAFTHNHKAAKKWWRRVFNNYDKQQKVSALKRWKENGHIKQMFDHQQMQNGTHEQIFEKNKQIGEQENQSNEMSKHVEELHKKLTKKAHKQLGNYMQRFYNDTTSSRFKLWRTWAALDVHKAKIIRSMIHHLRKHTFTNFRNACKTHITKEKQKERRAQIRQQIIIVEENNLSINNNQELMEQKRKDVKATQVRSLRKIEKKSNRIDKAVIAITRRNMTLDFVSRKRKIFESWRFACKQQKGFILCVINVLEKSMTSKGFYYIKNVSLEAHTDNRKFKRINMQINRFMKRNMGDFFNKWKNGALLRVDARFNKVKMVHAETEEAFSNHIKRIKKQNCTNIQHHFKKTRLKLIFRGWRKHKNYLVKLHAQQRDIADTLPIAFKRRALQKLYHRVEVTKRIRFANQTMMKNKKWRLKKMVWEGLTGRRLITTHLSTALCNLEKLMIDKAKMDGFKTVKSFSISKKLASFQFKGKAKLDIQSMLTQTYIRRIRRAFGTYRQRVKKILSNVHCHNLRWAFEHWRKNIVLEMLAEEQNQTGPITEEIFEANRTIRNLKDFMRDQHFTEQEIIDYSKQVFDGAINKMHWMIKRLKIPKENRMFQRCFDHWVFWIKVKRVMKYHLRFSNLMVKPVKCDIRWAFDKWRRGDMINANRLSRMDYNKLQVINIDQSKGLDKLAENEASNSVTINLLNTQRDELLTHYVRAQKLALGLLGDNHRRSRGLAFDVWKQYTKHSRKADGTAFVGDSVINITQYKAKIGTLEQNNIQLASENAELRQFSMDGFQIAKNVQNLSKERENLSADLADKVHVVSKLLAENKRLKEQLEKLGIHDVIDLAKKEDVNNMALNQGIAIR